ncbi:HAD family hydrolase [Arthrobacter sp. 131MFCol6.1]|uniref:HAD family hydrolase n=1 Tax=Arthrobacter sp. 131MFCol6.1 TaxID=1157944 RepID=UPI00037ADA3F|nr:HAD family hydrolase [Arthrobacter sp. 131MFCol6.1]
MSESILASWNEGAAKAEVLDFVSRATSEGPDFVAVADRIATFDNDGTLWVEKPAPPQFDFLLRAWSAAVSADPTLASQQPYKAIVEHDEEFFAGLVTQDPEVVASLEGAVAHSWAGTTPAAFDAEVRDWVDTGKQPRFRLGYTALVYRPMLELFDYLKGHDFRVFVCSGGGRDFMRVFAEETWGIPREHVIGSASDYEYTNGAIVRTDRMLGGLALGPGKPAHIYAQTGRLPVFAGGNADVDIEMLASSKFALLLNHDDGDREYEYTTAAEKSLAKAKELGWTVVSMKDDWTTIF